MAVPAQPIDRAPPLATDVYSLAALNASVRGRPLGTDASPAGNDGTPAGSPTSLPVGVSCEGTDDTIDFGDVGNIQQVSMWINPGSTTEQVFLADAGNYVHVVAGTVTYVGLTAAATYVNGVVGTTLAADQWQHLVCQFTQIDADNFELAVDGAGNFGDIDVKDLRTMDDAWSAARVAWEYRQGVPDDDLVLWTLGGAVDKSRFEWPLTPAADAIVGHDMEFDGTGDYIDCGGPAPWNTLVDLTVCGWVYWDDVTTFGLWVWNKYVGTGDAWGIRTNAGNLYIHDDIDNATVDLYAIPVVIGRWYHVAAMISSLENLLYLDGELVGSGTDSTASWDSFAGNLYIGARRPAGTYFNGRQRDFRVYSAAKSAAWVRTSYERERRAY